MSADQFFYVIFSTFTNREVFGLLTYYYSEVLLYSAIFGSSMLATSSFSINNCMMYRDAFLVIVAMCVHMVYVYSQNQTVVWGSFGLYIVYLIMDWKNDALTHLGMKMLGKIKDDDSFEGDYPLQIKRKRIEINEDAYQMMNEIIDENRDRYERNLKYHLIYTKLAVAKEIKMQRAGEDPDENMPLTSEELESFERKVHLRMKLGVAIYKHIFYLRKLIQLGIDSRKETYARDHVFPSMDQGNLITPFPKSMNHRDFDHADEVSIRSGYDDEHLSISAKRPSINRTIE